MCLILFSYRQHERYPFVFAANRDEFYERPTSRAMFWEDEPLLLAGRDIQGGGTWCGITATGRFAALTNVREPGNQKPDAPSRGLLLMQYLLGDLPAGAFLLHGRDAFRAYNGFNLIVGDKDGLWYLSNRGNTEPMALAPGLYGLSNDRLDTPWPKVTRGKQALQQALERDSVGPEALFNILADDAIAPDPELPDTGVGVAWERLLSPLFIKSPKYGTRCSTVMLIDQGGQAAFMERTHAPNGQAPSQVSFDFKLTPAP